MEQTAKKRIIIMIAFSLIICLVMIAVSVFATGRQTRFQASLTIAPNLLFSIDVAKVTTETPATYTGNPLWIPFFNTTSTTTTEGDVSFTHSNFVTTTTIDGNVVQFIDQNETFGNFTSEDVIFFRFTNLTENKNVNCVLAQTGNKPYSFITNNENTKVSIGVSTIFYVYVKAWYQNQIIDFPFTINEVS